MFKLVLEKAEEPEIELPASAGSLIKQESSRKISISALLTMPKPLTRWIRKFQKILKEMGIPDHLTYLLRFYMQVRKQQNWTWNNRLVLNRERRRSRLYIATLLFYIYAEYMRNAVLDEAQAGTKIAGRSFNNLRYVHDTTLMAESKEPKSLLRKVKEESGNVGLKLNIQKTKIMASGPITSWEIDGETVETVSDFIFGGGSKITTDGDCSHEIKRCLLLERKVMTKLDSIFKSRDITLPTNVRLVKAMFFQ